MPLLGSGFQQQTSRFLWVIEMSQCFSYNNSNSSTAFHNLYTPLQLKIQDCPFVSREKSS
jgi:hypothetical protein